jgi:uncharacterized protein
MQYGLSMELTNELSGLFGIIMDYFLCVIGMVMIIEGLPYFAFPEKMKRMIRTLIQMPEGALRRFGCVLMLIGLFFVYLGRQ